MYKILDYVKYYKNISFNDVKLNVMDNLIGSILAYLPVESFREDKSLEEFVKYAQEFRDIDTSSAMVAYAYQVLDEISNNRRYKDIIISNLENIKNDKVQFGALTIRINDITMVSYKGTDGSLIGWIENIRIAYDYLTVTQDYAVKYLEKTIRDNDKNIYLNGHSKGGNLAMVCGMEASFSILQRIKKIYNFDGPGLRKQEYESNKYQALTKKLVNIMPSGSLVGVLLYNDNYNIIKSEALGFMEHYPTSWTMFGQVFISSDLSGLSKQLHERTTKGIELLDLEKAKVTFETLFRMIEKEYSSSLKINFNDVLTIYRNMKNIDPDIKEYIDTIIAALVKNNYDN